MHLTVSRLQISDPYSWSKFRIRFFHICVCLLMGGRSLIVSGAVLAFGMIRHRNKGVETFCKRKTESTSATKSRWLLGVPGFLFSLSNFNLPLIYINYFSVNLFLNNSPPNLVYLKSTG